MKRDSVKSVSEFVKEVELLGGGENFVFRGQSQPWILLPKIAREQPKADWLSVEKKLYREFKQRSVSMLGLIGFSEHELLGVAQHHGIPTRLLDWSRSALSALWFSVREPSASGWDKDSAVYCMNLEQSDFVDEEMLFQSPFDRQKTKFFQPRHIAPRIASQEGLFSVHSFSKKAGRYVSIGGNNVFKDRIVKIGVSRECRHEIKKGLHTLGVHAATVFPDLSGIAELLTDRYDFKNRVVN